MTYNKSTSNRFAQKLWTREKEDAMKKFVTILLVLVFSLSLFSCNDVGRGVDSSTNDTETGEDTKDTSTGENMSDEELAKALYALQKGDSVKEYYSISESDVELTKGSENGECRYVLFNYKYELTNYLGNFLDEESVNKFRIFYDSWEREHSVLYITPSDDYCFEIETGIRNFTIIDGKVYIVSDGYNLKRAEDGEAESKGLFILIPKGEIPEGMKRNGEITVLNNELLPSETFEFYRELYNASSPYYEVFAGEVEQSVIQETNKNKTSFEAPLGKSGSLGQRTGTIYRSDYKMISSVEELSKIAANANTVDANVFTDNVIFYVGSFKNKKFRNFTVRDGKLYIVADYEIIKTDDMSDSDTTNKCVDLVIIPKNVLPESIEKEGKIEVISRQIW